MSLATLAECSHAQVERLGRERFEINLFRGFVRSVDDMGNLKVTTWCRAGTVARRKDAWRLYNSWSQQLINPRECEHSGIVNWIMPLDGGVASVMSRRLDQTLKMYWSARCPHEAALQYRLSFEWEWPILCLGHVASNALKNACEQLLVPNIKVGLDEVWAGIESLRHSVEAIMARLPALFETTVFEDEADAPMHAVDQWWEFLQATPAQRRLLSFCNPRITANGVFKLNKQAAGIPHLFDKLFDCFGQMLNFRKAASHRWGGIRPRGEDICWCAFLRAVGAY